MIAPAAFKRASVSASSAASQPFAAGWADRRRAGTTAAATAAPAVMRKSRRRCSSFIISARYRPLIERLELDDRGAVIIADPERHRRGGVIDEDAADVGRARQQVL